MEKVKLWFGPGGKEGYKWASNYEGSLVGLCRQPFCDVCDLAEREKLRVFHGGELEVTLIPCRRPNFYEEEIFYLGHLVRVPKKEARVAGVDDGLEFDVSKSNAFLYTVGSRAVLVDPGSMTFNGNGKFLLRQLTKGRRVEIIIVTHAHLDHVNHLGEVEGPVVMTKIAFQLACRHAAFERNARMVRALQRAKRVVPGEPVLLEKDLPFKIKTILLPHSVPETMGLVIQGKRRRVVHLADFKLTGWESESKAKTIALLREVAKEPVDILALTITNAHLEGFVPIEASVIDSLTNILVGAKGRVIITCFSSNQERIRRLVEVAQLLKRPVAFYGAGMRNAQEFLKIKTEEGAAESDKAVIFVTGCQAEEGSVLWRIANGKKPPFELRPESDTLVSSAKCIPGNEAELRQQYVELRPKVDRIVVNEGEIEQVGLQDLEIEEILTHLTGHECGGGLRLVLEIFQPREGVIAWPQTEPQITAFRKIAQEVGVKILPETERIIEI